MRNANDLVGAAGCSCRVLSIGVGKGRRKGDGRSCGLRDPHELVQSGLVKCCVTVGLRCSCYWLVACSAGAIAVALVVAGVNAGALHLDNQQYVPGSYNTHRTRRCVQRQRSCCCCQVTVALIVSVDNT